MNSEQLVALVGANGAGKTTLLDTISGLLTPTSGSIKFCDCNIIGVQPYEIVEKGIVHVPEGRGVFPHLSVWDNLLLGAYNSQARKKKDETLEYVLSIFPLLKQRKRQLAGTLSGGEQQMLVMARGLMARPKMYLLDEPSLGLSPLMVEKIFNIIKELADGGLAILLIEQNVAGAVKLADHVYVMETGKIVLSGDSTEILGDKSLGKALLGL